MSDTPTKRRIEERTFFSAMAQGKKQKSKKEKEKDPQVGVREGQRQAERKGLGWGGGLGGESKRKEKGEGVLCTFFFFLIYFSKKIFRRNIFRTMKVDQHNEEHQQWKKPTMEKTNKREGEREREHSSKWDLEVAVLRSWGKVDMFVFSKRSNESLELVVNAETKQEPSAGA